MTRAQPYSKFESVYPQNKLKIKLWVKSIAIVRNGMRGKHILYQQNEYSRTKHKLNHLKHLKHLHEQLKKKCVSLKFGCKRMMKMTNSRSRIKLFWYNINTQTNNIPIFAHLNLQVVSWDFQDAFGIIDWGSECECFQYKSCVRTCGQNHTHTSTQ